MNAILNPMEQLEAIDRALALSEEILKQGGMIDLSGVDQQVETLCMEMLKTEGPMRLKLLPLLENVISSLDRLEANLRNTHESITGGDQADKILRAHSAYGGKGSTREN